MTQPQDPKKSTRLGQISFFQICKWITDHMVEIVPGKTHAELCQFLNEVEELEKSMPSGGLGVHSIPSIIRATGYTPAAPGSRSKAQRTTITKAKFNELKREVAKLREEVSAIKESQGRLVTIVQEVREISPEDEPRSTDGDPAVREHAEVDKVQPAWKDESLPISERAADLKARDDNDAQLDDVYPEDAPHQEEPKKRLPGGTYVGPHRDEKEETIKGSIEIPEHPNQEVFEMFQKKANFEPSDEIKALISEETKETTNFPQ